MKQRTNAFTIFELLIALAIMGMLLASVAVAMKATLDGYKGNDEMAALTQSARSTLSQMMHQVRSCQSVDAASTNTSLILDTVPTLADGVTTNPVQQIRYDYQNGTLYCRQKVNGILPACQAPYNLIDSTDRVKLLDVGGVSGFNVVYQSGTDSKGTACIVSVTASLTFSVNNQTFTVTASGAPRRCQSF